MCVGRKWLCYCVSGIDADMNTHGNRPRVYSFMDCDPFGKAEVKVSSMDRDVYSWCREVAM